MQVALQLMKVVLFAAGTLLVVSLGVAALFFATEELSPSEFWGAWGAFRTGFFATLLFGSGPALLLGAPGYWWLWRTGRATWLSILPLGACLGALVSLVEPALAAWGIACGIIVSGLTHVAVRRWLGPNN